ANAGSISDAHPAPAGPPPRTPRRLGTVLQGCYQLPQTSFGVLPTTITSAASGRRTGTREPIRECQFHGDAGDGDELGEFFNAPTEDERLAGGQVRGHRVNDRLLRHEMGPSVVSAALFARQH